MNQLNKTTVLGLFFIIIGLVTVMNNLHFIPWYINRYIFQWENILIIIGLFLILSNENRKVGGVIAGIGLFLVIDDWFRVNISIFDLWPMIFVVVGIYIIKKKSVTTADLDTNDFSEEQDLIEDTAVFSGGDKVISSHNFRGGNLTAIFGGSNIDLTNSTLSPRSGTLELLYMFGGSKIRVPKEWNVEVKVTSIFGALTDKRAIKDYKPDQTERLYIKGLILFGGAEITN